MSRQVLERSLPSNVDAERSILGAIFVNNEHYYRVAQFLTPEDFYLDAHRVTFRVIGELKENGTTVDLITVQEALLNRSQLENAGGIGYLSGLMDGIPHLLNVEHYIEIVRQKSRLRRMIHLASRMMADAFDQADDPDTILNRAEQGILELTQVQGGDFVHTGVMRVPTEELLQHLYDTRELITGVATGFTDFDRNTSGLQPTDLIVIAARPAMGKTAFAMNIASFVAMRPTNPGTVGIFSLEMSKQQLMLRMLSGVALVDSHKIRTGYIASDDLQQLFAALDRVAAAPIFIDDSSSLTLMEMRAKCRRLKAQHGLRLVIVDYLGLITAMGKIENRTQEVAGISRGLKAMAKELEVPVIALCQLSRAPEQRTGDKRPQLSDLRDSGSIEQDADMVCFIYRDEVYNPGDEESMGKAELIISKQRNGPIGVVKLAFLKQYTKFENLLQIDY